MTTQKLKAMVTTLEATGNYRVLRRLDVGRCCNTPIDDLPTRVGCVVDVETTGLDAARDEILQLAMIPFRYSIGDSPRIVGILPEFNRYRQPSRPISRAITELTGINDATVAGHRIEREDVDRFMERHEVDFVVAHNKKFDGAFLVRAFPGSFANQHWLCSMSQVPWDAEALRGKALAYLAMQAGWFCRSHDAAEDCRALLALLNHPLPVTGRTALSYLLEAPRETVGSHTRMTVLPKIRIRAIGAPYESKDVLKARGYRWCPGEGSVPKAWYVEIADDKREAELAFLEKEVLGRRGNAVVEDVPSR